jgi:D-xylose transport system substrate-binding protein
MRPRRFYGALGLGVAAVLCLSACGSGSSGGQAAGTGAANASGSNAAAAAPANTENNTTVPVNTKLHGSVYFMWPNTTTPGWPQYYIPSMINQFKKYLPNVKLVQENGNNDQSTQLSQVEAAITQHASAVVLSPPTPTEAGAELKALAAAHIPVIGYNNDPDGGPVFAYVWVNYSAVGKYWGDYLQQHLVSQVGHTPVRIAEVLGDPTFSVYEQWLQGIDPVLQPMIKSGKVKVVCKFNTVGWVPATAQSQMENCLTKTSNGVDAVVAMNDSTSDGAASALTSAGLLGKVRIYGGHDGDLTVLQRILAGDQEGSFHPNGIEMGKAAAALIEAALTGKSAKSTGFVNATFDNHFVKGGVPTVEANEQLINKSSIQKVVIDEGIDTKAEICTSLAAKTPFCQ